MARAGFRHLIIGVAATALLAGCVEGEGPFAAKPTPSGEATGAIRLGGGQSQDVEAPEVFEVSETALWDGRPSLGGVWVASPDTTDPERVIMRNPANGKSVVGALFRRERDNPGPKLQISSDAAEALGLLAGQPAEINVIALRRTEPAEPEPAIAAAGAVDVPSLSADEDTAAEASTDAPADAAGATAVAAAALAAVDAGETSDAAADPLAGADATAAPAAEPPKKTWRERRAEAKARRQAERAAKAAAAGTAAVAGEAAATAAIVSDVETMPLDATTPSAAGEPVAVAPATIGSEVGTAAEAAPSQPAPAVLPTASRPIQIGFFSQEANADRAVAELEKAGVPATARREESNGKAYWTVTARGDAATLGKAKAAGFADAYFLK